MTTRDIVRDFIGILNILFQNPQFDREQVFRVSINDVDNGKNITSRFQRVIQ